MESCSLFSSLNRLKQLAPISAKSEMGLGGSIDVKIIKNMFASLKILGFSSMHVILKRKLLSEHHGLNTKEIATDIIQTLNELGFTPDIVKVDWLFALNEEGTTKILSILQGFGDKKEIILSIFTKGAHCKNKDPESIIAIVALSHWGAPRQTQLLINDGCLYLKQEGVLYNDELKLLNRRELFLLCKEGQTGLDLRLQDQFMAKPNFELKSLLDLDWEYLLSHIHIVKKADNLAISNFENCKKIIVSDNFTPDNLSTFVTLIDDVFGRYNRPSDIFLALPKPYKHVTYEASASIMVALTIDLLNAKGIDQFNLDDLLDLLAIYTEQSGKYKDETEMEVKAWASEVVFPLVIARANRSPINFQLAKFTRAQNLVFRKKYPERLLIPSSDVAKWLINHVISLNNPKIFINKNRGFMIQLLCLIESDSVFRSNEEKCVFNFYVKHAPYFFEICFLKRVCPSLNTSKTITSTAVNASESQLFLPGFLPELRKNINGMLSTEDQISLSSTNKYYRQRYQSFYLEKLILDRVQTAHLMSECRKYVKDKQNLRYWDVNAEAFRIGIKGLTPKEIFMKYPQYRKPEHLACDLLGLEFLVYGIEVMGPLTIQKIVEGKMTLIDAVSARLALEDTLTKTNASWRQFDVLEKYRLDGSLTKDTINAMPDQAKRNLSDPDLSELINFCFVPIERASTLSEDEIERITHRFMPSGILRKGEIQRRSRLNLGKLLGVEQCLTLTYSEYRFFTQLYSVSAFAIKKFTVEEGLFLFNLRLKSEAGWSALKEVIRPSDSEERTTVGNVLVQPQTLLAQRIFEKGAG